MVWIVCRRIQCLSSDRDLTHLHACVAEVEHYHHLMDHGIVTIDLDACLGLLDDRCIVSRRILNRTHPYPAHVEAQRVIIWPIA